MGIKRNGNGITYYKNITITASETGESLTGFFEAPTFVVENKLVIKVKDFNSLPDYGEIQVELDKDFFYSELEKRRSAIEKVNTRNDARHNKQIWIF